MTRIRSVDEFLDPKHGFNPTPAERALIAACRAGEECRLGDGTRPEEDSEARRVRAELIRLLILGRTEACGLDGGGVFLTGAFVSGHLDLHSAAGLGSLVLKNSRFEMQMDLQGSNIEFLSLEGSDAPFVFLGDTHVKKSVILRRFQGRAVDLTGVKIGGGLSLEHAKLVSNSEYALRGQRITVRQDMNFTELSAIGMLDITGANVEGQLSCASAKLEVSFGPALRMQGAYFKNAVSLAKSTIIGSIDLCGIHIGGQLACNNISIYSHKGMAVNAQSITADKDVTFKGARIEGTVDFSSATICGQLNFTSSNINGNDGIAISGQHLSARNTIHLINLSAKGAVDLSSANISGTLDLSKISIESIDNWALPARNLKVSGDFICDDIRKIEGIVSLEAAHVGELYDSKETWSKVSGTVSINGFTYDRLSGDSNIEMRLSWLERGSRVQGYFFSQPYTQLAAVYTDMGMSRRARRVLLVRDHLLRKEERKSITARPNRSWLLRPADWVKRAWMAVFDWIQYVGVGYGRVPERALYWLLGFWIAAALLSHQTWLNGDFAPNSAIMLESQGWHTALSMPELINPAAHWSSAGQAGEHWETFSPIAWGLDLVLPIELGQTATWQPTTARGPWGWWLWWLRWPLIFLGSLASALFFAAITGIMQRDRD